MLQLTYISTIAPGISADILESILLVSRRKNMVDGITGLLVFDGRRFLQALEGESPRVEAAFARISADPRHRAIVLLSSLTVETRSFGEWAMASHVRAGGAVDGSIAEVVDELTACVPDANARAHFRSFARLSRAA